MIELKVRKFGNSLGVVLPRDVIDRLRSREGEAMYLTEAADESYLLSPYDPDFGAKMAKADDLVRRYRTALRALDN